MTSSFMQIHRLGIDNIPLNNKLINYYDGEIAIATDVHRFSANPTSVRIDMCVIVLCTAGSLDFDFNGNHFTLRRNQVLFCQPNVIVGNNLESNDFQCKILCLSQRIIKSLLLEYIDIWAKAVYLNSLNIVTLSDDNIDAYSLFHAILQIKTRQRITPYQAAAIRSLLRSILLGLTEIIESSITLNSTTSETSSRARIIFQQFICTIANSSVKKQSVEYYAEALCITPKYLSSVCRRCSNRAAKDWIRDFVAEDIKYYLCHTSLSIKEIAALLGFDNVSFFGKYVRRCFNTTPQHLRRHR